MSTQACYPGDPQPYYPCPPYWQGPHVVPSYGTGITTWNPAVTEERLREIIREELAAVLPKL